MIYIHIPYCHRKCTYCAFYSAVTKRDTQPYADALCTELVIRSHEATHPIRTIYFGGGTPSLLPIPQLAQIASTLRSHYDLSQVQECTLEANPEDLTPYYLEELKALHLVDRISIGIQSFNDNDLHTLNRRHSAAQAIMAVHNAYDSGFHNISIDLIYGLPNQSLPDWVQNLNRLTTLMPYINHLSAYSLSVEPGTILSRQIEEHRIMLANEDVVLQQYHKLIDWTQTQGFKQYEISNFCKPGCQSKHNSRYWNRTPYLGIGAAAHSFDGTHRRWNVADEQQYISSALAGHPDFDDEELTLKDAYNEYIMTALRTTQGIDKQLISTPFQRHFIQSASKFLQNGLLQETATHYHPTPEGLLHADGIAAELFLL